MRTNEKRKYRRGDFAVAVSTRVPQTAFYEIEALAKTLDTSKAGIARLLLLRGLDEYRRDGLLVAPTTLQTGEHESG